MEAEAWGLRDVDRASRAHLNGGFDDVLGPISLACRDVSGQAETRHGRHSDVVGTADSGLEHAATPNGNAMLEVEGLDASRFSVSTDAAKLDVDDAACAERDGSLSVAEAMDALVKAKGSLQLRL